MRGFPLLRLILVALGLAVAGVPVWSLTRQRDTADVEKPAPAAEERVVHLQITSSTPALVSVESASRSILETSEPATAADARFSQNASAPDDLIVRAKWDAPGMHAIRIRVVEKEDTLLDQTFWAERELEDVVSFQP